MLPIFMTTVMHIERLGCQSFVYVIIILVTETSYHNLNEIKSISNFVNHFINGTFYDIYFWGVFWTKVCITR